MVLDNDKDKNEQAFDRQSELMGNLLLIKMLFVLVCVRVHIRGSHAYELTDNNTQSFWV